ncbi:BQ2448_7126 [Microbotryum intermedium]|uniref:BQ2448_7126 protein n=1 Tax=Microbotryum intermedium TaxID=269621 RepID=A0A238FM21_9BASI|nr:BQ2448_7126 [Microbotryum intermedium]
MRIPQVIAERAPAPTPLSHGGPTANTSINSDEWQLSVVEETSLIFEENDSGRYAADEPSTSTTDFGESEPGRLSTPSSLTSSQKRSVSGPGRSPRPPQVQFSPLSLAPSPLLGLPSPPPPPLPALIDLREGASDLADSPSAYRAQKSSASSIRTILKAPGTPGTGRSVRFTSSTSAERNKERSPTTRADPSTSLTGDDKSVDQKGASREEKEEEEEGGEEGEEESSLEEGLSSHLVASFLSRLQAVIPSPDSSLASTISRLAGPGDQSVVEATSLRPAVAVTSPTSSDYAIDFSTSVPAVGLRIARNMYEARDLFDESNPFAGISISVLAVSTNKDFGVTSGPVSAQPEVRIARSTPILTDTLQIDEPGGANFQPRSSSSVSGSPVRPPPNKSSQSSDTDASSPSPAYTTPDTSTMSQTAKGSSALGTLDRAASHTAGPDSDFNRDNATLHSATSRASHVSSSLYRMFMQKRSEGSRIAADEWGRLVHGGQAADEATARVMEDAVANTSLASTSALSPILHDLDEHASEKPNHSGELVTSGCASFRSEKEDCSSNLADHPGGQLDESYSVAIPPTYLSPIPELSEPNTTVDSERLTACGDAASCVGRAPFRGESRSSCAMSTVEILEASRAAEHPSFSLSVTPTSSNGASSIDLQESLEGVASLVATYDVWREHTTAQKSHIASLLAIIRTECQRKDAILAKLSGRNETLERQLRHTTATLDETKHTWLDRDGATGGMLERALKKNEALVGLVTKLTYELEARIQQQLSNKNKREVDLSNWQTELLKAQDKARDCEIRLRVAQATQADLGEAHSRTQQQVSQLMRENDALRRERDEISAKWKEDVITNNGQSGETVLVNKEEHPEQVHYIIAANAASENIGSLTNADVMLTVPCSPQPAVRSGEDLMAAPDTEQGCMVIERENAKDEMDRMKSELGEAENTCQDLRARLLDATVRLKEQDVRFQRFAAELKVKDDQIALHSKAWEEHQSEITRLMDSISLIEQEAVIKVHSAESELSRIQNELGAVIDFKEQQLQTAKNDTSIQTARIEMLAAECKKSATMTETLRNRLAIRESKYAALKQLKVELESDILGLNIALEAKQQEASAWKRQVQSARVSQMAATTPVAAPLGGTAQTDRHQPSTPPVATCVRHASVAIVDSRLSQAPPSQKGRVHKPSLGFGSSSRRDVTSLPILLSTPKSSFHITRHAGSKENIAPAFVRKRAASLVLG